MSFWRAREQTGADPGPGPGSKGAQPTPQSCSFFHSFWGDPGEPAGKGKPPGITGNLCMVSQDLMCKGWGLGPRLRASTVLCNLPKSISSVTQSSPLENAGDKDKLASISGCPVAVRMALEDGWISKRTYLGVCGSAPLPPY